MSYSSVKSIEIKNKDDVITISSLIETLQKILEKNEDLSVKGGYDSGVWEYLRLQIVKNDKTNEEILLICVND